MSTATDTRTYSAKQAAEAIGCTYRQLDWWIRNGVFRPSVREASGSGSRRRFDDNDILVARAALILIEATTCSAVDRAKRTVQALRGILMLDTAERPAGIYVTSDGRLSTEPVTGTYIALADLPPAAAPGPRRVTYRRCDCGRPCDGPYCSPDCAPGGAW